MSDKTSLIPVLLIEYITYVKWATETLLTLKRKVTLKMFALFATQDLLIQRL
jgi:hypothetical protein